MHILLSLELPSHFRPPLEGTGLLHILERLWLPSPHETEHADHPDQKFHSPFSEIIESKVFSVHIYIFTSCFCCERVIM